MGFFSELDIEVREMIEGGAKRQQVADAFPMLREDEIDAYFANDHDGDYEIGDADDDSQPSMYEEYQDLYGGDDSDQGQYEEAY